MNKKENRMDAPYENRFVPTPENDEASTSSASVGGHVNPRKKLIKRGVGKNKHFITIYDSMFFDNYVVNAKTGSVYPFKLGSKREDSLFSVILATGEMGKNPGVLFYNSPDEYEKHFRTQVSEQTMQRWHTKMLKYNTSLLNSPQ